MIKFSILIPSRGRPKEFFNACDALLTLAHKPDRVEIIGRIDSDDPAEVQYPVTSRIHILVGPRYLGYAENHRLIEAAASHSVGSYLMQYVDTAQMITPEWDRIYEEEIQGNNICVVASHVIDDDGKPLFPWSFPLIPRKLYELAGEFCLGKNPSVDRCWEAFAQEMDCGIYTPVHIIHREKRGTKNEDRTAAETQPFYTELQNNWEARSIEFRIIAKHYGDKVRWAIEDKPL